ENHHDRYVPIYFIDTYETLPLPLKDRIHTIQCTPQTMYIYRIFSIKLLALNFIGKITKRKNHFTNISSKKRFKRNKK
ncbi:hypothetical protein VIGAN_11135700, partial [Vigna angularis var. angularis]